MKIASDAAAPRRGIAVIALVATAHFSSHVMQLAVPPLFPILHATFGASFIELGVIVTLFYGASGLGQATAGFLVDRMGAVRVLVAGLSLLSLATLAMAFVPDYRTMLPFAVAAGLGNSVFHPADLSILSHRVGERMLGRAFAAHGLMGSLGYATAPVLVGTITAFFGWRAALGSIGIAGLCVALLLQASRAKLAYERIPAPQSTSEPRAGGARQAGSYLAVVTAPVVLLAFGYFVITAYGGTGIQTFSVAALGAGYDFSLTQATMTLTSYLVAGACGIVLGGFLADRTTRHHLVAMSGLGIAAAMMLVVAVVPSWPEAVFAAMITAGLMNGMTGPSRDVIVRRAASGAGTGSVFGFVYSGGDLGSATAPLLFGALGDHHAWHGVFLVCALAYAAAVPTVLQVDRSNASRPRPA
ncbi:MAG TPA: MFS transporter [Stellaceae bacterium]|nr:MFS transporter [Stellaceae bacterium]